MGTFLGLLCDLVFSGKFILAACLFLIMMFILYFLGMCIHIILAVRRQKAKRDPNKLHVGLFHPYCNAGGGGEKVLWVALKALQNKYPNAEFYIYTGDVEFTSIEILDKVRDNLNVDLDRDRIKFIYLNNRRYIEPSMYPYFTLFGQMMGAIWLGVEALYKFAPDVYIETTGFTFTLPLFKYFGRCRVGCYIHYPYITNAMLKRVKSRNSIYNNRSVIARSTTLTYVKLVYYHFIAEIYYRTGLASETTLVNSTFTLENLTALWGVNSFSLVYPPCEVEHLKQVPRSDKKPEKIRILSLAQFRPEKDHPLQLQALYKLREIINDDIFEKVSLVMCGSCRNTQDAERVKDLQDLSKYLSLENNVEFKINISFKDLLEEFGKAYIGIHTMLDDHFCISVVEQMAAGLIVVAHKSGGPLLDIIETSENSRLGFLATTDDEFAHILKYIIEGDEKEMNDIRDRAQASTERFSNKKFSEEFQRAIEPILKT